MDPFLREGGSISPTEWLYLSVTVALKLRERWLFRPKFVHSFNHTLIVVPRHDSSSLRPVYFGVPLLKDLPLLTGQLVLLK